MKIYESHNGGVGFIEHNAAIFLKNQGYDMAEAIKLTMEKV